MLVLNKFVKFDLQLEKLVSILVLMDVGLKLTKNGHLRGKIFLFQSLFWWMLVLNITKCSYSVNYCIVSILVLMDVGLKPESIRLCERLRLLVSILVLMDVGLKLYIHRLSWSEKRVSILVLMDVGLKQYLYCISIQLFQCFNPCFDGCWS